MATAKMEFMPRWYNELWNKGNEDVIDEMFHPEGKAHGLGGVALTGPAEFRPFYRNFMDTFADVKVTVDKNFADGDFLTSILTVNAVHKATGNPINFTGTSTAELKDGQLINAWNHFDFLTMYLQMGKITPEQLV